MRIERRVSHKRNLLIINTIQVSSLFMTCLLISKQTKPHNELMDTKPPLSKSQAALLHPFVLIAGDFVVGVKNQGRLR